MKLIYDSIAKTYTLVDEDSVTFLGPITYALQHLQKCGFTPSQAREAVLSAFFGIGLEIDLERVKKIASEQESAFYTACG